MSAGLALGGPSTWGSEEGQVNSLAATLGHLTAVARNPILPKPTGRLLQGLLGEILVMEVSGRET